MTNRLAASFALLSLIACTPAAVVTSPAPQRAGSGGGAGTAVPAGDGGLSLPAADTAADPGGCQCQAGQSCSDRTCVDDCRPGDAVPCAAPTTCDFLSGRCVPPDAGCVLIGTPVVCGSGEFPARCGPGSSCEAERCAPSAGCARVVCDASNFCRGADCPQTGTGGGVKQLTLAALPDIPAGAPGGVMATATVTADGLCGLSATFELRKDLELFVSAYNDKGIWRVPLDGAPSHYVTETEPIGGVTADRTGALYYALQNTGAIRRVRPTAGTPTPEMYATPAPNLYGLARLTFGPDGLLYAVADKRVFRFAADGTLAQTWTIDGSTFLTGLAFAKDGALLAGQHWPTIWRLPPGGAAFTAYLDATPMVPVTETPWNEGMALGPDGLIHVGVFPVGNRTGMIYVVEPMAAMASPRRLLGLTEMQRDVPATQYAGVHGIAFGVDGTLYFANQNTASSTNEAVGQVLARRPSGKIELVAKGLNFDWPRGYDGDIVVSQATMQSVSAPIDMMGHAMGTLPAPTTPGSYGVRVLVTDPRTGAIAEARGTVQVR
jgi:hypothetical protein